MAVSENCLTGKELGRKIKKFTETEKTARKKTYKPENSTYNNFTKNMLHRYNDMQQRKPQRTTKQRKRATLGNSVQDMMKKFADILEFYEYKNSSFFFSKFFYFFCKTLFFSQSKTKNTLN